MKKLIVALATLIHLLPHPFGMSTLGATALYAGAYGSSRTSWLVPLLPLALGISIAGLYSPVVMVAVFAGYAGAAIAGRFFLAEKRSGARFGGAVAAGAIVFFLLSNFGVWLAGFYPQNAAGLLACYFAGLPFLGIAVIADALYSAVLFGLHSLTERSETEADIA